MVKMVNRAKMSTPTTGTGTLTLGSAITGYQTFSASGVANADVVRYTIEDGAAWEIGLGTYTASGTLLSRTLEESSTGSLLNLSGNAEIFVTAAAEDLQSDTANTASTLVARDASGNFSAGTVTADGLSLGDNDKATFGAGNDLEIYHDGSDSYITDTTGGNFFINDDGAGYLMMKGSDLYFRNPSNVDMIHAQSGGFVKLYHNGVAKLATTSTGIDVTGTATMDGLVSVVSSSGATTVSASLYNNGAGANTKTGIDFYAANSKYATIAGGFGAALPEVDILVGSGTQLKAATFSGGGDISFYEDTGTTPKFFWDASAESLGLGTTSPSSACALDVQDITDPAQIRLKQNGNTNGFLLKNFNGNEVQLVNVDNGPMVFKTNDSERLRIDSSGNVGIGTSSPTAKLHIEGNTNGLLTSKVLNTNTGASASAYFTVASDSADITMIATSAAYTGVSGWADTGVINTSSSASGGMLFNVQASAPYRFMQGATNERMRIDSSGNVLVGKTSADYNNATRGNVEISGSSSAILALEAGSVNDYIYNSGSNFEILAGSGQGILFQTNGSSERMRIDASGNVGIGTTSPNISAGASGSTALTISASTADNSNRNGLLELRGTRSGTGNIVSYMRTFNNSATTPMTDIQSIRGSTDTLGEMAFRTSNSEAMRIDSSGDVGIGTSLPVAKFHVTPTYTAGYTGSFSGVSSYNPTSSEILVGTFLGSAASAGDYTGIRFQINGNTSGIASASIIASREAAEGNGSTALSFLTRAGTGDTTERMRITSTGNVVIGATAPIRLTGGKYLTLDNASETGIELGIGGVAHGELFASGGDVYLANRSANSIIFRTNTSGAERMRIDSSGNVGIGTSSPDYTLDLGGATPVIRIGDSGSIQPTLTRNTSTGGLIYNTTGQSITSLIEFKDNGTERMRIDSSGNLLVGGALADVNGLVTNHLFEGANSTAGDGAVGVYNNTGTANAPALVVLNRDTSTDSSNRFVQFYANVTSSTAQTMGGIVGNGVDNVQFASISDVREKTNIESINGSLDKIKALNPVEFDWITSGEHCKAGFIAQEVEEVFPEFVVENMASEGEEERKGLTGGMTGGIVAHLVKAIQEQQAMIEELKAEVTALKQK